MSRHYSTRSFFRQVPSELLVRYFKGRGLFGELNFAEMSETGPEALLAAWGELPEHPPRELEAEFRQVFEMSSEKGIRTLLDEARRCWPEGSRELEGFIGTLSSQPGHFHRAMAALLSRAEMRMLHWRVERLAELGVFPRPGPGRNEPWPPV